MYREKDADGYILFVTDGGEVGYEISEERYLCVLTAIATCPEAQEGREMRLRAYPLAWEEVPAREHQQ